jgi:hypothetical protein
MTLLARLDPSTYSDDQLVGVAAVSQGELPDPVPDERWQYIPERVWSRIQHLGSAYELHFAALVEPVSRLRNNSDLREFLFSPA